MAGKAEVVQKRQRMHTKLAEFDLRTKSMGKGTLPCLSRQTYRRYITCRGQQAYFCCSFFLLLLLSFFSFPFFSFLSFLPLFYFFLSFLLSLSFFLPFFLSFFLSLQGDNQSQVRESGLGQFMLYIKLFLSSLQIQMLQGLSRCNQLRWVNIGVRWPPNPV